ncbi:hypothetical protein AVEN_57446-1 [Araneus ventricosus]|uniref:Uncharacterized protein n=1 Tax=Araneus ventricosus TaxID=182803 RepID=A0A4Y2CWT2_ARAVE|nr:hypothetical protein AVEN_57446-1 [Araneus ventricosus]
MDQIKRKVSQEVKDHFIDDRYKLNSQVDLVEKLDDYDTFRSTFRSKQPRKEWHYDKQNSFKDDPTITTNEKNFPIDEKVNPVCLKRLETAQLESDSLQIKDSSQQKIMGNLANDLKMIKNELRLLQGDIKNLKKERHSLFLQIREKNKHVENLKSSNDSLVKMNAYYVKMKSGKLSFRKGEIMAVRRNPKATVESTKTQPRYRGPIVQSNCHKWLH